MTLTLRYCILSIVTFLAPFLSLGQISLDSLLEAYYPLDGNAMNVAGNSFHGIISGPAPTIGRNGNPNSAYFFDGVDDEIELQTDFDYRFRTVNIWFNAATINSLKKTFYDSDHATIQWGKTGLGVRSNNGIKRAEFRTGAGIADINGILENNWYMLTFTLGPQVAKCYLNGVLGATMPVGFLHSSSGNSTAALGHTRLDDRHFHGALDDVRIYSRALSDCEIQYLYNGDSLLALPLEKDSTCGSTIQLNGPPGYQVYRWDLGDTIIKSQDIEADLSSTGTDIFTLYARDQEGCFHKKEYHISSFHIESFDLGTDTMICNESFLTFSYALDSGLILDFNSWDNIVQQGQNSFLFQGSNSSDSILQYQLIAAVSNNSGECTSADTVLVSVYPKIPNPIWDRDSICFGDTLLILLDADTANYAYQSQSNFTSYFDLDTLNHSGLNFGVYNSISDPQPLITEFQSQVTNEIECSEHFSMELFLEPEIKGDIVGDSLFCPQAVTTEYFLDPFYGYAGEWGVHQGEILNRDGARVEVLWHWPRTNQFIKVPLESAMGCPLKDLHIDISDSSFSHCPEYSDFFLVPNMITPNGDGKNDYLEILRTADIVTIDLVIFNRWGEEIFRKNDYRNEWGNDPMISAGTYFYQLRVRMRETKTYNGSFTLIR